MLFKKYCHFWVLGTITGTNNETLCSWHNHWDPDFFDPWSLVTSMTQCLSVYCLCDFRQCACVASQCVLWGFHCFVTKQLIHMWRRYYVWVFKDIVSEFLLQSMVFFSVAIGNQHDSMFDYNYLHDSQEYLCAKTVVVFYQISIVMSWNNNTM